jgi:CheY-like chemotaxis protein
MSSAEDPELRIWAEWTARSDEISVGNMRVLCIGCDWDCRTWLKHIGVHAVVIAPDVSQLLSLTQTGDDFSHVVLNLDAYESTEDAVEALLDFRARSRTIVVIALTALASSDDLGSERSAICDATLRLPLTGQRLEQGLIAGQANRLDALRSGRGLPA